MIALDYRLMQAGTGSRKVSAGHITVANALDLTDDYEAAYAEFQATLGAAADVALAEVRRQTPRRLGTAQASWQMRARGDVASAATSRKYWTNVIWSSDKPPKMRWLEGRYRIMGRGLLAAQGVIKGRYPDYFAPPVDLAPLW